MVWVLGVVVSGDVIPIAETQLETRRNMKWKLDLILGVIIEVMGRGGLNDCPHEVKSG